MKKIRKINEERHHQFDSWIYSSLHNVALFVLALFLLFKPLWIRVLDDSKVFIRTLRFVSKGIWLEKRTQKFAQKFLLSDCIEELKGPSFFAWMDLCDHIIVTNSKFLHFGPRTLFHQSRPIFAVFFFQYFIPMLNWSSTSSHHQLIFCIIFRLFTTRSLNFGFLLFVLFHFVSHNFRHIHHIILQNTKYIELNHISTYLSTIVRGMK